MSIVARVAQLVQILLGPLAEEVGRDVPVIKRHRKFSASTLAQTFILGFLAKRRPSVEDLAQMARRCGVEVTPQAVEQRVTQDLVTFLEALVRRAVRQRVQADESLAPLVQRFPAVLLHDSTSIALPDELSDRFPGCGGSHGRGRAAMKLQVRLDLRGGALDAVAIEAGRDCDQRTPTQLDALTPGSLRIADLGYFDTKVLRHLGGHGVFWISRLAFGTEILTPAGAAIERIADLFEDPRGAVDREVVVGKEARLACRVVIWRAPAEVANRRRQRLIAAARDKGDAPPSRKRLDWCDWTIFVTNVPPEQLSVEEVGVLYRARWQIELLFRRWKSLGGIAEMIGATVVRQLVGLWSRLLAVLVQHWMLQAGGWGDVRCSHHKAWGVIRDQATHLAKARGCLDELARAIDEVRHLLAKAARRDKRKQPGTFELLNDPSLLGYEA
jgi:Transposase DDE domain